MNPSVFERLAERFSNCQPQIERIKAWPDWDIQDVMEAAGRKLFTAMSSGEIDLGDIPQVLKTDPKTKIEVGDSIHGYKEIDVHSWDWYWLAAAKWLALNNPEPDICLRCTLEIYAVKPENHIPSGPGVVSSLMTKWQELREGRRQKAFKRLATLSEDACLFLAGKLASKTKTLNTDEESETAEVPSGKAENVFKKTGDFWTVRYHGENIGPLKELDGMSYIAELLKSPHKPVSALELVRRVKNLTTKELRIATDEDKPDECDTPSAKGGDIIPEEADAVMDRKSIKECDDDLVRLNTELNRAKKNNDDAEQIRVQEEIDKLKGILSSSIGLGGRSRQSRNDPEKAKDLVRKAVERVEENISDKNNGLYQHLKNCICTGLNLSYRPDREMDWQF